MTEERLESDGSRQGNKDLESREEVNESIIKKVLEGTK